MRWQEGVSSIMGSRDSCRPPRERRQHPRLSDHISLQQKEQSLRCHYFTEELTKRYIYQRAHHMCDVHSLFLDANPETN